MTQRNAFRGPGLWNTDLAIAKSFKIGERFNLQFRADAFNLFNHSNLYVIGSTADSPQGGQITSEKFFQNNTPDARFFQLSLKYAF